MCKWEEERRDVDKFGLLWTLTFTWEWEMPNLRLQAGSHVGHSKESFKIYDF